jgi:S1-C subfamily serine protease
MLLPSLLSSLCLTLFAVTPGMNVDTATDDQAIFAKLESATSTLADSNQIPLTRAQRLSQCQRTHTTSFNLSALNKEKVSGSEVFERAANAAVLIGTAYKCDKCNRWHNNLACGVIVDPNGVIATNYHVVGNETGEAMGVMTADEKFYPVVEILAANKFNDVALLRIKASNLPALSLRDSATAGSPIYCYSHPANTFGCLSEGIIARYTKTRSDHSSGVFMQITADFAKGSSGGPILDEMGNLIGLVSSTSTVFYDVATGKNGTPSNPQMVRHNCTTARAILDLIAPEKK